MSGPPRDHGEAFMARYRSERKFNYPVDDAVRVFLDGGEDAYDMHELENVTAWKVVKEEDDGVRRVGTKEWCAHGQIPRAAQHIFSPKMLTWFEHSVWDRQKKIYSFEIEPRYLRKQISCKGQTAYMADGPDKMKRIFEITLKIDIPLFGPILEAAIMELLKKNEEQDFKCCAQSLEKKFGKK